MNPRGSRTRSIGLTQSLGVDWLRGTWGMVASWSYVCKHTCRGSVFGALTCSTVAVIHRALRCAAGRRLRHVPGQYNVGAAG